MALPFLSVEPPLSSSSCSSTFPYALPVASSSPSAVASALICPSKPWQRKNISHALRLTPFPAASPVLLAKLVVRASASSGDDTPNPPPEEGEGEGKGEPKGDTPTALDLPLESKEKERMEQKLRMKLAKKKRLRRKRLVRKRRLRKKGRWPPSKMRKNKNV